MYMYIMLLLIPNIYFHCLIFGSVFSYDMLSVYPVVGDYQPLRYSLTFSDSTVPSNCTRTVEVIIFDDMEVECTDETFLVILSSTDVLVQLSNATAVIHIQDNDCKLITLRA